MEEKNSILDALASLAVYGFVFFAGMAVIDVMRESGRKRRELPEHIVTSRGRILLLHIESDGKDNVFSFETAARRVERPRPVAEMDASQTDRADSIGE